MCKEAQRGIRLYGYKQVDNLTLVREPHNPYDKNAIAVKAWGLQFMGYIPKEISAKLQKT